MKGFYVAEGYKGYIPSINGYILFPSEQEYYEYLAQ